MKKYYPKTSTLATILTNLVIVTLLSSCSFFNKKEVAINIDSKPSGADIYIDGNYYGQTPKSVTLSPAQDYEALLVKEGQGSTQLKLKTQYTVRGNRKPDNIRCTLDATGTMLIIPIFGLLSTHCRDFASQSYLIEIPNNNVNQVAK